MSSPGHLDATSGALVSLPAGSLPAGGVTRSNAPVVLSLDDANYTKWSIYMKASIGRAGLIGHVDGTTAANPADPTEDVADKVLSRKQTARQLWLSLLELFSANKASKAIYLDNDFRQLVQGASSIAEYCRRQKQLADALADNDSPVSNRALVLNTLRGLGPRFASAATVISMTDPLPTFVRARSMLLMEEMQQANAASNAVSTALVAQARPSAPSCTGTACRGDSSSTGSGKPFTKQKKNKPQNGGGSTTQRPATPAPSGPWVCFSPGNWQWRAPGILGPRPAAPQAYHTTAAPLFQSAPSSSSTPTWDNSALIAALNSLALGRLVSDCCCRSHGTAGAATSARLPLHRPGQTTCGTGYRCRPRSSSGRSPGCTGSRAGCPCHQAGCTGCPAGCPGQTTFGTGYCCRPRSSHGRSPGCTGSCAGCPGHQASCTGCPAGCPGHPAGRTGYHAGCLGHQAGCTSCCAGYRGLFICRTANLLHDLVIDPCCTVCCGTCGYSHEAMQDPNWRSAMADEHHALLNNNTWSLVPRPPGANIVTGKWIFRHKFHSDGTLARYKARWVVRGYSQHPGIDYDEMFSLVVKPATIRLVLTIAVSSSWPTRSA
ncbi:hypothetical protein QYE76_028322 [Lolium multiflorum]|uniref:Reverse transcriptase Ty1/copia-type domain-containing protein n=1 Tax=Lolium multiflorum TaxID=4521 RepID=A0AAD8QP21_LOLMU|nr:hypothetical protein QYE76_028322 [Lolium multiflorum]